MHGLGCWFDIDFQGSAASVVLSTAPGSPGTHWYQCRLLLPEPIAVNRGQVVSGVLAFKVNEHFSYDLTLTARLEGTPIACTSIIRLQDQVRWCGVVCAQKTRMGPLTTNNLNRHTRRTTTSRTPNNPCRRSREPARAAMRACREQSVGR